MRHVLSALVQNQPGVLRPRLRHARLRGFNIESLAVGETEHSQMSRMTSSFTATTTSSIQVRKQLDKVITRRSRGRYLERETSSNAT